MQISRNCVIDISLAMILKIESIKFLGQLHVELVPSFPVETFRDNKGNCHWSIVLNKTITVVFLKDGGTARDEVTR